MSKPQKTPAAAKDRAERITRASLQRFVERTEDEWCLHPLGGEEEPNLHQSEEWAAVRAFAGMPVLTFGDLLRRRVAVCEMSVKVNEGTDRQFVHRHRLLEAEAALLAHEEAIAKRVEIQPKQGPPTAEGTE